MSLVTNDTFSDLECEDAALVVESGESVFTVGRESKRVVGRGGVVLPDWGVWVLEGEGAGWGKSEVGCWCVSG